MVFVAISISISISISIRPRFSSECCNGSGLVRLEGRNAMFTEYQNLTAGSVFWWYYYTFTYLKSLDILESTYIYICAHSISPLALRLPAGIYMALSFTILARILA